MKSFEAIFGVPAEHRLELVMSRVRGGLVRAEYWRHEEFDSPGTLIAGYESYSEVDPVTGTVNNGWRRFDATGALTHSENELPELLADLLVAAA
jgi:hypothetical protein